MRPLLLALPSVLLLAACAHAPAMSSKRPLDSLAEQYVRLVLALGVHDPLAVDSYFGPPKWREEAEAARLPLPELLQRLDAAIAAVEASAPGSEEIDRLRRTFLLAQLRATRARAGLVAGEKLSFDEEALRIYGVTAPRRTDAEMQQAVDALAAALPPGSGTVAERLRAFEDRTNVPPERIPAAFSTAIAECRRRTLARLELPAGETFTVELVKGEPWLAYNWFKGGARSVIQVNVDLPVRAGSLVGLACHEGYPGHHVTNAIAEQALLRERGFVELSVYPLFSPQSLVAEGAAQFGRRLAFDDAERVSFERDVVWPAAGLDPADAELADRIDRLEEALAFNDIEVARRIVDGGLDDDAALALAERFLAEPPDHARALVSFHRRFRAYAVNYRLGEDLVRAWVDQAGTDPAARWQAYRALVAAPRTTSDLVQAAAAR